MLSSLHSISDYDFARGMISYHPLKKRGSFRLAQSRKVDYFAQYLLQEGIVVPGQCVEAADVLEECGKAQDPSIPRVKTLALPPSGLCLSLSCIPRSRSKFDS